ncbi:MAG: hypothetical protein LQ339_008700 [Xanthoria mediterranea]|nr:MAG: hypothetical protein LQ339_008700 [Xanthoria mediterranea]
MGIKRNRDTVDAVGDDSRTLSKKARKGFSVGPANLPDGTYRRKVEKIKDNLIRKAKVKRSYNKIKGKEPVVVPKYYSEQPLSEKEHGEQAPASMELHPARQAMLEEPPASNSPSASAPSQQSRGRRPRRPKPVPYEKEARLAQERKKEKDARREAVEKARLERQHKIEERERFRKAMAKARTGGKNGQRKLGRESKVLLEKVQNLVAE